MKRFDGNEIKKYWETHSRRWADIDFEKDPGGLGNVCHAGAPLWLNEYYAKFQVIVYKKLLKKVGVVSGAAALDVGCGAARWCRLLADSGYSVTGIDLQPDLIEKNKARFPDIEFHNIPIQDFNPGAPISLVSSVTVIQHIPFDEQEKVFDRIREVLAPGGHALIMENVTDQGPHVFSRSITEWQSVFEKRGFETLEVARYDYSPSLRMLSKMKDVALSAAPEKKTDSATPEDFVPISGGDEGPGAALRAYRALQRLAVTMDSAAEHMLIGMNAALPTYHCGFLFRKKS